MSLIPTDGTVLQLIPATGTVELECSDEKWQLPLIAYGVVVSYVDAAPGATLPGDHVEYEADVQPVVLVDGMPTALRSYIRYDVDGHPTWRVV
ncbi:MAG TPA: hypothetical protein VGL39_05025 [Jatrophihabitantaceae bacterium]|jgi:hypothetical protein